MRACDASNCAWAGFGGTSVDTWWYYFGAGCFFCSFFFSRRFLSASFLFYFLIFSFLQFSTNFSNSRHLRTERSSSSNSNTVPFFFCSGTQLRTILRISFCYSRDSSDTASLSAYLAAGVIGTSMMLTGLGGFGATGCFIGFWTLAFSKGLMAACGGFCLCCDKSV